MDAQIWNWLIPALIVAVVLFAFVAWFFITRKVLMDATVRVDDAWNAVADQLKRRGDLVPNVIAAVREFAETEEALYKRLENANRTTVGSDKPLEAAAAEADFQVELREVYRVAEAYPKLTQQPHFMRLKTDLMQTEDKIQAARRQYNGTVRNYNRQVTRFPNSLVSGSAHAQARDFYEVRELSGISEPPRVQF